MKNFSSSFLKGVLVLTLVAGLPVLSVFAELETVNLAIGYIPHVQFSPLYVGMEKGFYADEGIELKTQYGFGVDIFSLLASGKIDLGLSDSDQLIIAGSKGLDLRAVFQYYRKYPVTIVAKANTIKTPEDFAGKTIGVPELYGTSFIGLKLFLERYNLLKTVKIERIGYTQIPSLLTDRIEGAVCFFNNEPLQFRSTGVPVVQWDVKDFSDMVGASFLSSEKIIEKRGPILAAFARATAKALAYTIANVEDAYLLSEKYIGKQTPEKQSFFKAVLTETCELFRTDGAYGSMDVAQYQASVEDLVRLGLIPKSYDAKILIRNLR